MDSAKPPHILRTEKVHSKWHWRHSYLCGTKVVGTNANRTVYVEFHSSSPPQSSTRLEAASRPSSNAACRSFPGSSRPADKAGMPEFLVAEAVATCSRGAREGDLDRCSGRGRFELGGSSESAIQVAPNLFTIQCAMFTPFLRDIP